MVFGNSSITGKEANRCDILPTSLRKLDPRSTPCAALFDRRALHYWSGVYSFSSLPPCWTQTR
jgi:hypothetical protein